MANRFIFVYLFSQCCLYLILCSHQYFQAPTVQQCPVLSVYTMKWERLGSIALLDYKQSLRFQTSARGLLHGKSFVIMQAREITDMFVTEHQQVCYFQEQKAQKSRF